MNPDTLSSTKGYRSVFQSLCGGAGKVGRAIHRRGVSLAMRTDGNYFFGTPLAALIAWMCLIVSASVVS